MAVYTQYKLSVRKLPLQLGKNLHRFLIHVWYRHEWTNGAVEWPYGAAELWNGPTEPRMALRSHGAVEWPYGAAEPQNGPTEPRSRRMAQWSRGAVEWPNGAAELWNGPMEPRTAHLRALKHN